MKYTDIDKIIGYILARFIPHDKGINHLKLQKLLYYTQAWYLAFYEKPIFKDNFQAWVHGPVQKEVYDKLGKQSYDENISLELINENNIDLDVELDSELAVHVNKILDGYGKYEGWELELMTHDEAPWRTARRGYAIDENCDKIITHKSMQYYYSSL